MRRTEGSREETTQEIYVPDYVVRDFDVPDEGASPDPATAHVEAARDGDGPAARLLIPVASVERLRSERRRAGRG